MILKLCTTTIATLGVGKIPKAPGTWGSLLGLLVWWALFPLSLQWQAAAIVVAFCVGWVSTFFYEKWNHCHDPKEVVVDELVGMWITLFGAAHYPTIFFLGFLFFRFFDIWKPFPIGWVDRRVPGALGTLLDDVVAGVFAFILLNLGLFFFE